MANTFNFLEVKFKELSDNLQTYIEDIYNKASENFSPASPYWHIIEAVVNIHESAILYLKTTLTNFDINNPSNNNAKMIRFTARVAGYDPSRSISATGTIALKLRPEIELDEIGGQQIVILNGTKLNNKSNGKDYFIDLGGVDQATYNIQKNKKIILPLVQGDIKTQNFTGNGLQSQSFNIVLPSDRNAEQFRITVKVNGEVWEKVESFLDMLPDQNAWYCRSGINGGVDIYFGTNNFGKIPSNADSIEVTYVESVGSLGNLPSLKVDDFTYIDDIFDGFGVTVDVETSFFTFIEGEIGLGADTESVEFTKAITPYVSRNFVLARPENYIFQLKRLNVFSQVDAYTTERGTDMDNNDESDDSVVYVFLVPNISLFLTGGNSYFDLDINAFTLDDSEKTKIRNYLKTQGTMTLGTSLKILDPIVRKYAVNVFLRIFEDAIEENIRAEVENKLSNFFVSLDRRGRIDKSAIIKIVEEIDGVDSVSVGFVSEQNEAYHKRFVDYRERILRAISTIDPTAIVLEGYEPDKVLGLDPIFGDIVYTKDELPIIRGGFLTRGGVYYNETPQDEGLGSLNVSILGISSKKLF